MAIPSPRMLFRIGAIVVAASLVFLGISLSEIGSGGEGFPGQSIAPHSSGSLTFSRYVNAGDDLEYIVTPEYSGSSPISLTVYLVSPGNQSIAYSNVTISASVSDVIVAPQSGTWQIGFQNNGNSYLNFTVYMSVVPFVSLVLLDLALALLVSGGGILILAYVIRRREISIALRRNY